MTQDDFTVTPYAVRGDVDYDRVLEQFGADELSDAQRQRFPDPVTRSWIAVSSTVGVTSRSSSTR